ncbi:MAG TPA: FecR domain-containing protein, partial [Puia sp.]|nr:FecR domain-containing protein [Puia sp.]
GVAALIIIAAGVALIRQTIRGKRPMQYETAVGEYRRVVLPDGATMELEPGTTVTVEAGYNRTGRSVILLAGEAHFNVLHKTDQPFTVEMKHASVRDIGTTFTVSLREDSICVKVSSGKIEFIQKQTGQTQEVAAGSNLVWNPGEPVKVTANAGLLRFDNAPLSQVVTALGLQFGKKILLNDTALAARRLTIDLGGESFDAAITVICASLNLDSKADSSGYVLQQRVTR